MLQALTPALSDVAWWLQSASQVVPISQLSLVIWLMFVVAGSFDFRKAFKAPEQ